MSGVRALDSGMPSTSASSQSIDVRASTAQTADALQVRRFELENQKSQMTEFYLTQLNSVLSNTQLKTTDPATLLSMITTLGKSSSTVQPVAA